MSFPQVRPFYIAAAGTLTIGGVDAAARLGSIVVNTGAASAVLTCYDGTAATGRKFATIDASAKGSYDYAYAVCKDGITVVMSGGNADVTVNAG